MSVLWCESGVWPVVTEETFKRHLRMPVRRAFSPALQEAAEWARTWFREHGRPWTCAAAADASLREWLAPRFGPEARLVVIAASAGPEAEAEAARCFAAGEPDRYYFLECLASAAVETLLTEGRRRVGASRQHCPGYPGWSIEENTPLREAVGRLVDLPGPLEVLPSGMLRPKKSQLAVCVPEVAP